MLMSLASDEMSKVPWAKQPYGYFYLSWGKREGKSGPFTEIMSEVKIRAPHSTHEREATLQLHISSIEKVEGLYVFTLRSDESDLPFLTTGEVCYRRYNNPRMYTSRKTYTEPVTEKLSDILCRFVDILVCRYILDDVAPYKNNIPEFNWYVGFTKDEIVCLERLAHVCTEDIVLSTLALRSVSDTKPVSEDR